jgi:hypothetical protein
LEESEVPFCEQLSKTQAMPSHPSFNSKIAPTPDLFCSV